MDKLRLRLTAAVLLAAATTAPAAQAGGPVPHLAGIAADGQAEFVQPGGATVALRPGEALGDWTLMAVSDGAAAVAVLEDFVDRDEGRILYVDATGIVLDLPKSAESTEDRTGGRFLGYRAADVKDSASDLLGDHVLAGDADPDFETVASAFPPITRVQGGTFDFVGTPDTFDKVWFNYGGRSANFDPAIYQPSLIGVRDAGKVQNGLVGGWLPVLRFVYPEAGDAWTEMLAFAPFRKMEGNDRIQPVWYRVSRIEAGRLAWTRYVDTYVPFPPRETDDPALAPAFYAALRAFDGSWRAIFEPGIRIDLPDTRAENLARFGLVRSIMTRVGDYPKYGVLDRNYGGAEHDGFPDTFTVETTAMIDWGLLERAGRYLDNYLSHFVRADGSLVYRGPETGQYGRMLTVAAQYVGAGGDVDLLLRHRERLDGIARLLLTLRADARRLPPEHPAYGMIAAWSEADSVLEADPGRYMQPYFSNSTEAARGFRELGAVWAQAGAARGDEALARWGHDLAEEGEALEQDIQRSIGRSLLQFGGSSAGGETVLPSIAGVREPFHIAVARDPADPQHRAYRANMEMLYSGSLSPEQANLVIDYRARHHDILLGVPTAYGYKTGEMAGFLAYGHAYGLLQQDRIREALLLFYSLMAHQYTRGSWLAPETRRPLLAVETAPYCTPAQLAASLVLRWLLVFEDPREQELWLAKGVPRAWLQAGRDVRVQNVPTRWGLVAYRVASRLDENRIDVTLRLPPRGIEVPTVLRLRTPGARRMQSVRVNGSAWRDFGPVTETITLPPGTGGRMDIRVRY